MNSIKKKAAPVPTPAADLPHPLGFMCPCASSVFRAHIRTTHLRSVTHAARMTCPCLFHTGAPCLFQAVRKTHPASSTIAPCGLCLLPTPPAAAYASSTRRWPRLGPTHSHGHQCRWSAFAT
jgi:hypothetical protein